MAQRNLYLSIQLIEMERPVVIALNMMDEVAAKGDVIDVLMLSKFLNIPVIPVTSKTGEGTQQVIEEAIKQAIEYGIEHNLMKEFLEENGAEVANMLLSGWNMDEALAVSKEEGYEDGFEDGRIDERKDLIRKFSKIIAPEQIAETLHVPKEYVLDVLNEGMVIAEPEAVYEVKKEE